MQDLHSNISPAQSIAAAGAGGGITGSSVDLQGYEAADIQLNVGSGSNDGTYSVAVEESDDGSTGWSAVASGDLQGSLPSDLDTGSDIMSSVGYLGTKRHVRVTVTEDSSATTAPTVSATVVRGAPRAAPV